MDLKIGREAFKDGLKALREIGLRNAGEACKNCPISKPGISCCIPETWTDEYIDHVSATVEQWCKDNRPKTLLEVLLERFPYAPIWNEDNPKKCPSVYFGEGFVQLCRNTTGNANLSNLCHDCWNRVAPDKYQPKD